jgi:hypothetical protein
MHSIQANNDNTNNYCTLFKLLIVSTLLSFYLS